MFVYLFWIGKFNPQKPLNPPLKYNIKRNNGTPCNCISL